MNIKMFAYILLVMSLLNTSSDGKMQKRNAKLCYFTAANSTMEDESKSLSQRRMIILMEPAEFSEINLRELALELFNKYTQPENLDVSVYTHVDQIEKDIDGPKTDPSYDKYPYGGIFRTKENEFIRYAIPPDGHWKTIVLKGKG